ncbi:MAG: chorismate synthase [Candidatus Hecatellales archaeon]|nr:MAG: chorismate synthase [Candidatus Hecatellales archaeon]
MSNSLGRRFKITLFGESHGRCVGVVVEGCPPGLEVREELIQAELDKRKPGGEAFSTPRLEEDKVEILSGVFNGRTTGAPICMVVWNRKQDSTPYEKLKWTPRPGHADYPAYVKYRGFHDYRGGGIFSARLMVGVVAAGALAKQILREKEIDVLAHVVEIGGIGIGRTPSIEEIREKTYKSALRCVDEEASLKMQHKIEEAKREGDSLGGIVECLALNLPAGLGDPLFNALDADLAHALFCIPAVKGVEFGAGFKAARMKGSENNDPYTVENGRIVTLTNNAGGVLGGMSTGMPLIVRVAFKPPSSIAKPQQTVNLKTMKPTEIKVEGKHDVCFVPRAVPIVEAMVACVLADHLLLGQL